MYRSSIGHVSVEYRWFKTISVDTFIGRLSPDMSTESTYGTHDPTGLAWKRLRIVDKGKTFSYKYFLNSEEKYGKTSDYWTFNYFKFSHFIAGTSATLTVCVTILICYFAWTTTSTTLSSASSSPRAGNFNWPLVLFNEDGKLQFKKKIDEWMKTWRINIFTFFEMLARIFVFLFLRFLVCDGA